MAISGDEDGKGETLWESAGQSLGLSRMQVRILIGIGVGKSDKEIARDLKMSFGTLRTHLSRAFAKTQSQGRTELAMKLAERAMKMRYENEREGSGPK